jgi:putative sigma-54 modulation protein
MATHSLLSHTCCDVPFTVEARGLALKNPHHHAIQRILTSTLGRFAKRLRAIHIWIEDVNGPRGGKDIRCRIKGHLHPHGSINVSALAIDAYAATARAAARARELVDRRVKKKRSRRRQLLR